MRDFKNHQVAEFPLLGMREDGNEVWVQKLKNIGLTGYEARVYLSLLGETSAPVARLVRKSGVPQSKVYAALDGLVDRGFAQLVLGDRKLYRGVPPEEAYSNYQRSVHASLGAMHQKMRELAAAAPSAPAADPQLAAIRLFPAAQYDTAMEQVCQAATRELLACGDAMMLQNTGQVCSRSLASAEQLDVRFLFEAGLLRDTGKWGSVLRLAESLPGMRLVSSLPLRFVVADRAVVLMELRDADGGASALVIPNHGLAEHLRTVFEARWQEGRPLSESVTRMPDLIGAG